MGIMFKEVADAVRTLVRNYLKWFGRDDAIEIKRYIRTEDGFEANGIIKLYSLGIEKKFYIKMEIKGDVDG